MRKAFFFLMVFILMFSCKKPEKYSVIPEISYIGIPVKNAVDTLGNNLKRAQLTFYLVDGDGDIGFKEGDTTAPFNVKGAYYNNILINMYKIVNGNTIKVDTPEIINYYNYRTTYIDPIGQNKTLKCTIYVNLDFDFPSQWDSLKFDLFMYDRALHKSNIVTTDLIVLN